MSTLNQARHLLLNYMKLDANAADEVASLLTLARPTDSRLPRSIYQHEAGDRLLELVALPDLGALGPLMSDPAWLEIERSVRPRLAVDFRRQVHTLRYCARQSSTLPTAASLQLTRMEVAPKLTQSHQALREQMLYPHAEKSSVVESFLAFDSLISTEPGVLYLTGFSCEKSRFVEEFATGRQREFLTEVALRFVIGGEAAIHSSLWLKRSPAA
jgi:hypothetical protein